MLPHQTVTSLASFFSLLNFLISSLTCSAKSHLVSPFFTCVPSRFLTKLLSKTAVMGFIFSISSLTSSRSLLSRTPALITDSYALSSKMSHAANSMSLRSARGTKSFISGDFFLSLPPSLMVCIWLTLPYGFDKPFLILITPAINVVLTAPNPGNKIPSLPSAGFISIFIKPRYFISVKYLAKWIFKCFMFTK